MPETGFDPDLRKQVARDARLVVAGNLSEAAFYQNYHQAYLKEFGTDQRPLELEGNAGGTLSGPTLDKHLSRRTLLKLGGLGIAGLVGSRWLGTKVLDTGAAFGDRYRNLLLKESEQPEQTKRVQMGMVIDLEKCDGCLNCVFACNHHNSNPQGVYWIYVLAYKDENQDGTNFLVRPCQHCSNPPCVKVCPVRARHKRENDGLVLTDYNLCIGCRYCMVTCPYGVNYFQWDEPPPRNPHGVETYTDYRGRWVIANPPKGVMGKCDFCPERLDSGRNNVVCELTCPHDVIQFGDMNDPNSRPNQYLAKKKQEKGEQLSTFRLLEDHGTKPNVLYIGHHPSRHAKPVDGPVTYADWGLAEKRLPYLGNYEPWFLKLVRGAQ